MSSKLYTVTNLTIGESFPYIVSHFDYQDENRKNEAIKKWHHECEYYRNLYKFFKCYILDEDGNKIKFDTSYKIGNEESKLFTLIITLTKTVDGDIIKNTYSSDYTNFNSVMVSFHHECEYNMSLDSVISYVARIENEFGYVEVEEVYNKEGDE